MTSPEMSRTKVGHTEATSLPHKAHYETEKKAGAPVAIFIAHESPYDALGGVVGGAASVPRYQSEHIDRTLYFPTIVAPKPHNGGAEDERYDRYFNGVPRELFKKPEVPSNEELVETMTKGEYLERLHTRIRRAGGDQFTYSHYWAAGAATDKLRPHMSPDARFIYMGHSWDKVVETMDPGRKKGEMRAAIEPKLLQSHAIIVSTKAEKNLLAENYKSDIEGGAEAILARTHVVPLGVDHATFNPRNMERLRLDARKKFLPPELQDSKVFYSLGRLSDQKSYLETVQGFSEVAASDPKLDIALVIYGGPLDNAYHKEMKLFLKTQPERIQDRVIFTGPQNAIEAHSAGDYFIFNSKWETWGLAMTEAMAAGKPVITSNKPILREVVGKGGLLVDETKPSAIAGAMRKLATDKDRSRDMAHESLTIASGYTWERSTRLLETALASLR